MAEKSATDRFVIRKSRTGLGLFSARRIKRGSFVVEYVGRRVLTARNNDRSLEIQRYLFEINNKWTLDGSKKANIARHINHSCRPNAEAGSRDKVIIRALQEISAGEEVTLDYGEEYFDEFIRPGGCRCLSCDPSRATAAVAAG